MSYSTNPQVMYIHSILAKKFHLQYHLVAKVIHIVPTQICAYEHIFFTI
jgi:hypothetical protein